MKNTGVSKLELQDIMVSKWQTTRTYILSVIPKDVLIEFVLDYFTKDELEETLFDYVGWDFRGRLQW